jgi:hypothetical protein
MAPRSTRRPSFTPNPAQHAQNSSDQRVVGGAQLIFITEIKVPPTLLLSASRSRPHRRASEGIHNSIFNTAGAAVTRPGLNLMRPRPVDVHQCSRIASARL